MTCLSSLQKLADSNYRLAAIETDDPTRIIDMFRRFHMETGCAVYEWNLRTGLNRMGFEHIMIPRTRTPIEITSYVNHARHFGIYLFNDFGSKIDDRDVEEQLKQICSKNDGVRRLIIFLGNIPSLPDSLKTAAIKIQHKKQTALAKDNNSKAAATDIKKRTIMPFSKNRAVNA